jgi:hypothetical protein
MTVIDRIELKLHRMEDHRRRDERRENKLRLAKFATGGSIVRQNGGKRESNFVSIGIMAESFSFGWT